VPRSPIRRRSRRLVASTAGVLVAGLALSACTAEASEPPAPAPAPALAFAPCPAPPGEEPATSGEDSAPPSSEPATPGEEPAPPSSEPAPPSEEPAPPGDEPAPPGGEPLSRVECAELSVPLDYERPDAGTASLAVARAAATDPANRVGVLVLHPGGPGGSAVEIVQALAEDPSVADLTARFDLVGIDPRGTGASTPALECTPTEDLVAALARTPAEPELDEGIESALAAGKQYAADCAENSGDLLPLVGTGYAVRDVEELRIALGEEQLNLFGLSYGTILFNAYADAHPDRVRTAVLDGGIDPTAWRDDPWERLFLEGIEATEGAFDRFLEWCSDEPELCGFGAGDAERAFDALVAALDGPAAETPDGPALTGATLISTVSILLNGPKAGWPQLGAVLAEVERRERTGEQQVPIVAGLGGLLDIAPANVSVECTDFAGTLDPAAFAEFAAAAGEEARFAPAIVLGPPYYDPANAATCAQWPVPAEAPSIYRGDYRAEGAPPVLVVGTTGDPSTPYSGAQAQARTIADATLLTFEGEGHTAFFSSPCVQENVTGYLVDGTVPEEDTVCTDEPQPTALPGG
jgi:pimeloyl-ACP methyl ester carboxylesterase